MLITKLKDKEEIIPYFEMQPFIFKCCGCSEVFFPEEEIDKFLEDYRNKITAIARVDYLCREEFCREYIKKYSPDIDKSGCIIVFSCGVGVQVTARLCEKRKVIAGCDTCYLNGFQGLSAHDFDCRQCGECYLNHTGGICPITACSKGLLNGPCGGAQNGKCEVNPEIDCGWELIYKRLKKLGKEEMFREKEVLTRDYRPQSLKEQT